MLIGYNTNGFAHHRLTDAIEILSELGYAAVGLTVDVQSLNVFSRDHEAECADIAELLHSRRMACVIETGARFLLDPKRKHQPTLLDPFAISRQRRSDMLKRCIELAAKLNAPCVSLWSGTPIETTDPSILMDRLAAELRPLCDMAAQHQVKIAFEPEPGMFIDTMPQYAQLHAMMNHPAFGLTLDVGHLHCLGELPVSEHINRWKDVLWNVHIEDMKAGVHDHLMFGDGDMNFIDVLTPLRDIDYQHGIYVELSRHSHNAVETARKSLSFLMNFV